MLREGQPGVERAGNGGTRTKVRPTLINVGRLRAASGFGLGNGVVEHVDDARDKAGAA